MAYDHHLIDKKWQKFWDDHQTFHAEIDTKKPKYYALDMFPYPSGSGLHVGHLVSYTPTDIVSRYKRAKGFNVLHPMGYDAFGLPAEQYAIQTGIHPAVTTDKAIKNFRTQLKSFGISFDWQREFSTCDPKFYKWTQFIFLKLFEKGLAYQKEVPVNWCPALRTVLANEEVVDGKSERGGHPVIRLPMKQWMLKITAYAEKLLEGLDRIDWPERTKEGQRNWIGKSVGANVAFPIQGFAEESFNVFTTRPDTLYGVTFMVTAPENPILDKIVPASHRAQVQAYQEATARKSEVDRKANAEKTGVFTGAYAIHPLTQKPIPIWASDYVLMDYGTGAIMAVPGHDARDFEFAQKFGLDIVRVLEKLKPEDNDTLPFEGEGKLVQSEFLNGLGKTEAIDKMIAHLEKKQLGTREVQYKLRDWLFSRQRYWGEPFPVVHFPEKGLKGVPVNELPVLLPDVANYQPSEKGEPPLARVPEFVNYKDPVTGEMGERITDTMPGTAGSSWYFLRYIDPHNEKTFCDFEKQKYWMPVDLYIGGPEHTVSHLLYSRFWQKVLFDAGLVSHDEPFKKLAHQGMLLGADGEKMSKSRGNTIQPEEVCKDFGADAVRVYITFLGPLDRDKPWATNGIEGVRRFLDRVWRLTVDDGGNLIAKDQPLPENLERLLHKTIKKVTDDIETLSFNTAISAMMILVNDVYAHKLQPTAVLKPLAQLLMPFAPHLAEELWEKLGGQGSVALAPWPTYKEELTQDESVTMAVQVNGKTRGTIQIAVDAPEADAVKLARSVATVENAIQGQSITKIIYKPGKILNLIVR